MLMLMLIYIYIYIYIYSLSTVKIAELMSQKYLQVSDAYIIVSCKYEKFEKSMRSV